MSGTQSKIILIDPPTFPRGVRSLSLAQVAASLTAHDFAVEIADLNYMSESELLRAATGACAAGIKVSAQNLHLASSLSARLREAGLPVFWGGEYPTLCPDLCAPHCNSSVSGHFDAIAAELAADLRAGELKPRYESASPVRKYLPRLDLLPNAYPAFMGWPLETSRGCQFKCTFCMVHSMQPTRLSFASAQIAEDLERNPRDFVNIVDYNFDFSAAHVNEVAAVLGRSSVRGWTCELCLESLNAPGAIEMLASNRCQIVYCGLESITPEALVSVNKRQNVLENYESTIRRVREAGIDVAAGAIAGLAGYRKGDLMRYCEFAQKNSLLYLKFTFLTFNPGTKVKTSMLRKGSYVTEDHTHFDGNHLSFLSEGLNDADLYADLKESIRYFYHPARIWQRTRHHSSMRRRLEAFLFAYCYGESYRQWLEQDVLQRDGSGFESLLRRKFSASIGFHFADVLLAMLRKGARFENPQPGTGLVPERASS